MTIAMYGMGPVFPDRWPPADAPQPPRIVGTDALPWRKPEEPMVPETVDQLRARLSARATWLENELRMHDAWRAELETIRRMIAALAPPDQPARTER